MKKLLLLAGVTLLFGSLLVGCNPAGNKTAEVSADKAVKTQSIDPESKTAQATSDIHAGKQLAERKCFFCHSPDAPEHRRIAPPMVAIKAHYINEDTTKAEFIAALQNFVEKPTQEKAKMPGAIRKFGLMPYQEYKPEDIALIGEYLFDYQIEEPEWFKEHWQQGRGGRTGRDYINTGKSESVKTQKTPAEIGLEYALGTKKELGKNLMGTIKAKGTVEALAFCNEQAYPLTQSKAEEFNANIKRVSDKPRNPNNQASIEELNLISHFKNLVEIKADIEPIVISKAGEHRFFYPIVTNSMCLQCHGEKTGEKPNIEANVLEKLNELYPDDKATGYQENQVRGIWSISFDELSMKKQ